MKKTMPLVLSMVLPLLLLLLSSCQRFSLDATDLPSDMDGKHAVFMDGGIRVDSVPIQHGAFRYSSSRLSPDRLSQLLLPDGSSVSLILEQGSYILVPSAVRADGYDVVPVEADTLSLNARYVELQQSVYEATTSLLQEYESMAEQLSLSEVSLSHSQMDSLALRMDSLNATYVERLNHVAQNGYKASPDDVVGVTAFRMIQFEDDASFVRAYESASETVQRDVQLLQLYRRLRPYTPSAADFTDFVMNNDRGEQMKLSDYMDGEHYLLVDFWASWCGPCRRAMPRIAKISTRYPHLVRVLSVGTWEQSYDDYAMAKRDLGITWDSFYDSQSAGAMAYGVSAVPTLILLAPNGEIVARSHSPREVERVIQRLPH